MAWCAALWGRPRARAPSSSPRVDATEAPSAGSRTSSRKAGALKHASCRKKKRQATRKKKALNKSQRNQKISLAAAALSKCCVQRRATTNTKLPADGKGRRENEEEEENFLKKCWSTLDPDTVAHEHRRFFFRDNGHGAANAAGFSWFNGS